MTENECVFESKMVKNLKGKKCLNLKGKNCLNLKGKDLLPYFLKIEVIFDFLPISFELKNRLHHFYFILELMPAATKHS